MGCPQSGAFLVGKLRYCYLLLRRCELCLGFGDSRRVFRQFIEAFLMLRQALASADNTLVQSRYFILQTLVFRFLVISLAQGCMRVRYNFMRVGRVCHYYVVTDG